MTTGYANGVITVDLAETDEAHRERVRRTFAKLGFVAGLVADARP